MLVLTFHAGPEPVGLDIRRVREVVPRVRLRKLANGPDWLAGVFVYRGRVIPVVDLHRLTGHGDCPPHLSSRVILLALAGPDGADRLVGLLASRVDDLRDIPVAGDSLLSLPTGGADLGPVVPDGKGVIRLLDPDRLLPPAARQAVLAAAGGGP